MSMHKMIFKMRNVKTPFLLKLIKLLYDTNGNFHKYV